MYPIRYFYHDTITRTVTNQSKRGTFSPWGKTDPAGHQPSFQCLGGKPSISMSPGNIVGWCYSIFVMILDVWNGPDVLSSSTVKVELYGNNFSENSNLGDSVMSLPLFPSRNNLKLHNISVTPKTEKGYKKPWFIRGV